MDIEQVLACLANTASPPSVRLEMAIRLSMWMQFSADNNMIDAGVFACALRYGNDRMGCSPLPDWHPDMRDLFMKALSIPYLTRSLLRWDTPVPDFDNIIQEFKYGITDLDAIAESVEILTWCDEGIVGRHSVSLQKIHRILFNRRKDEKYYSGLRTFLKIWRRHCDAAAWIYLNKYHLDNALMLDPTSKTFAAQLDRVARDKRLIEAIGHARWVSERLSSRLHDNLATRVGALRYPDTVPALSPPRRKLSRNVRAALIRQVSRDGRRKSRLRRRAITL